MQVWMMLDRGGEGVLHEPVDPCLWESSLERHEDGNRSADVAEGAGPDHQDARWIIHAEYVQHVRSVSQTVSSVSVAAPLDARSISGASTPWKWTRPALTSMS